MGRNRADRQRLEGTQQPVSILLPPVNLHVTTSSFRAKSKHWRWIALTASTQIVHFDNSYSCKVSLDNHLTDTVFLSSISVLFASMDSGFYWFRDSPQSCVRKACFMTFPPRLSLLPRSFCRYSYGVVLKLA